MDQAASATKPYISQTRHDRTQDSLTPGGNSQVVRENAGWSRSPRAHSSFLMLGVVGWSVATDQSAWRALTTCRRSSVKRERAGERDSSLKSSKASIKLTYGWQRGVVVSGVVLIST